MVLEEVGKEKLVKMFETMVRIRTFEERVSREFAAGNIPGIVHLYLGEEAVATGACASLNPDDYITSTHRGHGHLIAKGGETRFMMAELYGKKTGYCQGKGGSMHVANTDIGMLGANSIVGAGIVIAGGAALSAKLRGTNQVVICFFGDGAGNTSRFHEGINMASHWKLPIVYVIENNRYAISTRTREVRNIDYLSDRAVAYNIPGVVVDGNDVIAVYEAEGQAVTRARKGQGPSIIECMTQRWHGHTEGDNQNYKSKEEIEADVAQDSVLRFRDRLVNAGVLSGKEADQIHEGIIEELDQTVKFARESPYPDPEETLKDIFA